MPRRPPPARHAPWLYVGTTLAWTWALWGLAAAIGDGWLDPASLALFALGGLGPLVVAGALVGLGRAAEAPGAFWRRALDPRAMSGRWWLVVLALAVLPPLVVRLASHVPEEGLLAPGPLAFLVVGALAGAAEEPGWRGYAQEGLQRRMSVLAASLVVGLFWAAWHLPLFWIEGTYQHGLGAFSRSFWLFHLALLTGTVIYGWLYNAAGGVTIAAVAFHGLGNVANELFPTDGAEALGTALQGVIAVLLVVGAWRWLRRPRPGGAAVDRPTA
jgi:uncharacterized protein